MFLIATFQSLGQNLTTNKTHSLVFGLQFYQIKEGMNYGLVFNGINLAIGYEYERINHSSMFRYKPKLDFGVNFQKGIGLNWRFTPIDVFYGFQIFKSSKNTYYLGPYISTNYLWQLYPELQSGHLFWYTLFDIGPKIISIYKVGSNTFSISIATSVMGFTSRPEFDPKWESHFYTLRFFDWVEKMNSNFNFGSFGLLNHTDIEVEFANILGDGLSLAYEFEYFGYFDTPKYQYLSHSLNFKWCIGNNNKSIN